jgi:hypothetical protein
MTGTTKLTNKQKEALAFEIMGGVTNRLLSNQESGCWMPELEELASTEEGVNAIRMQAAKWMMKLPGELWDIDLPKPWEQDA